MVIRCYIMCFNLVCMTRLAVVLLAVAVLRSLQPRKQRHVPSWTRLGAFQASLPRTYLRKPSEF